MHLYVVLITLALACGGQCAFAASVLQLKVDAGENLRYQLDCLSGHIRCTRAASVLDASAMSDADLALLDIWRTLRLADARVSTAARPAAALTLPTPGALADISSRQMTGHTASPAVPADSRHRRQLRESLTGYFQDRFDAGWANGQAMHLERLRYDMQRLLTTHALAVPLARSAALFGQSADALPSIQLIAISTTAHGSLATLGRDAAYIESPLGERAEDRLPVVVHELVHHWLSHMPASQQARIVTAFTNHSDACAITTYHLFEESLAAAIGNGHFERLLSTPDQFARYQKLPSSFYADPDVDAVAKRLQPLVSRYIAEAMAIDDAFVARYVELASDALGRRCESLQAQLRSTAFLLTDSALQPARELAQRRLASTTSFTDVIDIADGQPLYLTDYPALSAIVVSSAVRLPALRSLLPAPVYEALEQLTRQHSRVVFGWRRSLHSTVYLVIGQGVADSAAALLQFVSLNDSRFDGVWLAPPLPDGALVPERYEQLDHVRAQFE